MKANIIVDISPSISYLGKILVLKLWAKMLTVNLQKSMEDRVDFLPADKHESFLKIDSITFGLHSRACPRYPKQLHNIFAIKK